MSCISHATTALVETFTTRTNFKYINKFAYPPQRCGSRSSTFQVHYVVVSYFCTSIILYIMSSIIDVVAIVEIVLVNNYSLDKLYVKQKSKRILYRPCPAIIIYEFRCYRIKIKITTYDMIYYFSVNTTLISQHL